MPQERLDKWFYNIVPWNGFLEEAYRCLKTEIPRIEPELALAYASALLGHIMYGTIDVGSARIPTSFYVLAVGETGTAKSMAWIKLRENLLKDMMRDKKVIEAHTGGSFEGIAQLLADFRSVIHFADEVQRIFQHRKHGGYLGDIVDLWKIAWYRTTIFMPRRSRSKTIDVPEGYMFSVIATTTPDDLEDVLDAIGDKALLRRILPVRTKARPRLGEGEPADWSKLKAIVEFTEYHAPIEFIVENPRILPRIVDTLTSSLGADPESWIHSLIEIYTVKFAAILTYDKLIACLISLLNRQSRQGLRHTQSLSSTDLQSVLSSYVESLNRLKENPHVAIAQNSGAQTQVHTRTGGEGVLGGEDEVIKIVEELSKKLLYTVEDLSKKGILVVENVSRKTLLSVEVPFGKPPLVEWDRSILRIWVDNLELVRAAIITVAYVFNNIELYEMMGMNSKWAYFLFDVVDMRLLARYMKKFGGRSELEEYVDRAVMAGYLTPTTKISSREDLYKVQFYITIPSWGD